MPIFAEKLQKLEPYFQYEKYGVILRDAVEIWKQDDVMYKKFSIGVYQNSEGIVAVWSLSLFDDGKKRCCLIGASLVNKPGNDIEYTMKQSYNILSNEVSSLQEGFDGEFGGGDEDANPPEAYLFAREVSKILFDE